MIDKQHRFQGRGSLRFVYQKGQTVRSPLGALKYVINQRRTTFRVAVVVSRKVNKSAVVRNRIRRRIYEAVRQLAPRITDPYDIVIIVYSDLVADMPAEELQTRLSNRFTQARIITAARPPDTKSHAIVNEKEHQR